jgi:DNA-binding response OmpR family regulator/biotin operon repressor
MKKKKINVLVVDDDRHTREALHDLLKREGFLVNTATNGKEGLELVEKGLFHLVVTDIMMPEMDGIELLKSIRTRKPNLGVILITAYATVDYAIQSMRNGALDFIKKPFDIDDLLNTIKINTRQFLNYIDGDELINNKTRDVLYDYVLNHPGEHFRAIQEACELGNGVLDYHLHILEKNKIIKSKKDGIYKRYYLYNQKVLDNPKHKFTEFESNILELLQDNPLSQKDIADEFDTSKQRINYYIQKLKRAGYIYVDKKSGNTLCYLRVNLTKVGS